MIVEKEERSIRLEFEHDEELVDVTIKCIERYGITKLGMTDISKGMRTNRQVLHKRYGSRKDILCRVLVHRLKVLVITVKRKWQRKRLNVPDGIVFLIREGFEGVIKDDILMTILQDYAQPAWTSLLIDQNSPIAGESRKASLELWGGLFKQAREQGALRKDKDDVELMQWIGHFQFIIMHANYDDKSRVSDWIQSYLFPSIFDPKYYQREFQQK